LGILLSCLIVVGGISGAGHQKNFANVIEAQDFIENTIQLKELHIKQTIPYSIIYHSLQQQCDPVIIKEADLLVEVVKKSRTSGIYSQTLLKKEMESRFTILKNLIPSLKTDNEKMFCKQKYLTYSLLEYTQGLYLGTINAVTTQLPLPEKKPLSTPIRPTPMEQLLEPTPSHGSATAFDIPKYLTLTTHQLLTSKVDMVVSQFAEASIQKEIGRLIALGFLTPNDIEILNEKIELKYLPNCGTTQGSYHMTQRTDGSNRQFKSIKLNINLCNETSYLKHFDQYVRQIFIHEMAHYFYYFKDNYSTTFGAFCRQERENICTTADFVSNYAMKNQEEDYAESFTHRYLKTTTHNKMIVDGEHGSAEVVSKIQMAKEIYFSSMYPLS
jgi:hypothetical protein